MTHLRGAPTSRGSRTLLQRIRFDTGLEETAFLRLSELDVDGCRAVFGRMVAGLEFDQVDGQRRDIPLLLLDVLQRVNRRLHPSPADSDTYQVHRLGLIAEFSALSDPESARGAFMPALNRLLAALGTGAGPSHRLIDRARAYIEENYHQRISLSSVAERLNVSPNYLSRLFRKETGDTLTAHVQHVRLRHALVLLAEGGRSISEIAYLVGYQNYRDFYRNFVKYQNESPREVRRRLSTVR